jgi:hypothetical protein
MVIWRGNRRVFEGSYHVSTMRPIGQEIHPG